MLSLATSLSPKKTNTASSATSVSTWERETIFFDGDEYFDALIENIEAAKDSVNLETYIYVDDALGQRVSEALCRAAKRKVSVRALVDGVGSPTWNSRWCKEFFESGAKFRTYHRLPWLSFWQSRTSATKEGGLFERLRNLNRRNHRKLLIIDGKSAWVGSMNISAVHLRSVMKEKAWRDTGLCVEGEGVDLLQLAFERAWLPWRARRRVRARYLLRQPWNVVRLNSSMRLRRRNYRDLVRRIRTAKSRIWITTPYFVPNGELLDALSFAAKAGADVRILVPAQSDVFFMPWVAAAFVFGLAKAGAKVYRYQPRILHSKTLLIDDWATVGSSNFNHRSMFHDLEVDVVLTKEETRAQLAEQFLRDLDESKEVTSEDHSLFSAFTTNLGRLLLVFRGWL